MGILPLLLVAALSALAVVAVYEIRGRLARPERRGSAGAVTDESSDRPPATPGRPADLEDDCADLRHRYLLRCPPDVDVPAIGATPQPPAAPQRVDTADEARAAAELAAWLHPSGRELAEMAGRCEARFDMPTITENLPPRVDDEAAAALSLSSGERTVLQQTLDDMHKELRDFVKSALAETMGPSASALTLEEALTELETRPENGFEEAREKLARERAGLLPPPPPGSPQSPGERLLRRWASTGAELERRLADALGSDRARQLRSSPKATWMNRFSQSGCRRPL